MPDSEDYRITRKLGSGLAGPVFFAEGPSGNVAIRQFQSGATTGSGIWSTDREHFLNGARSARALVQPRIVQILDIIDEEDEAYSVMEYVSSPTLEVVLARETFSPEQANYLLRRMASTLDFAHQKGIAHGDFKPSNVFILPDRGVKLSDFVISPRANKSSGPVPPNWAHPYLSPEHISAPPTIGPRSDQYSLAAVAYHMFTGRPPFSGGGAELASDILAGRIAAPTNIRATLPQSCDAVLLKALSKDPERRYGSNGEFVDALEASLLAGTAPLAAATQRRFAPWMFYILGAVALLLAALFTPLGLFTPKNRKPPIAPPIAKPEQIHPAVSKPAAPVSTELPKPMPHPKQTPAGTPVAKQAPQQKIAAAPPLTPVAKNARTVDPPVPTPRTTPPEPLPPRERDRTTSLAEMPPDALEIAVYSRQHKLTPGISFGYRDPVLGEMGYGDLKVRVESKGPVPKGKLTLEWVVDEIRTEVRPIGPNQLAEYGNEPTAGLYKVTLWLDGKTKLRTFTFRISP
jgi:serine/threonine-protein kinase